MARILVIDDDALVRKSVVDLLAKAGHDVREAANGREGERVAGSEQFDIIVTDILMAEQEGIETIVRIRRHNATVKILAISGGGRTRNLEFLSIARKLGADAALAKPFDKTTLLAALGPLLPN